MAPRRSIPAGFAALGAGLLVALSLPPWGWWPLALVGFALLDRLLADRSRRSRFARTWLFGVAWLGPGMGWMWYLTAPGYIVATLSYAAYLGAAAALAPGGRWRWLGLPAAITIAEAIRWAFPFGGVPLASLAISQVSGPLAPVVRVGGSLLLTFVTVLAGCLLSAVSERAWRPVAALAVAAVAMVALATIAPSGHQIGTLRIAGVQGGGPQGTRAKDSDPQEVFQRHVDATGGVTDPVDLILWPENVIDVATFAGSSQAAVIADLAARHGAPLIVGITEDDGPDHFTNAQVVVTPDGDITGRFDKVHRVPFGEYMPLRGLLEALGAPTQLVPRDATAGTGPAVLDAAGHRFGVAISWEIFFANRARDATRNGGQVLLNPTNGSSYTGTILQTQQIASSRLRALETGRSVMQVAPTGFTAVITSSGTVLDRTAISETAVVQREVALREGLTIYTRLGDGPVVALMVVLLAIALVVSSPRARSSLARR